MVRFITVCGWNRNKGFPVPETGGGHSVLKKVAWRLSSKQYVIQTSVKTIAQEINLEQVISSEMLHIVSPVILERDIEPSFYRLVHPVHGHVRRLNNFGCLWATWWKNYVWTACVCVCVCPRMPHCVSMLGRVGGWREEGTEGESQREGEDRDRETDRQTNKDENINFTHPRR